jgi:hypothetical protein
MCTTDRHGAVTQVFMQCFKTFLKPNISRKNYTHLTEEVTFSSSPHLPPPVIEDGSYNKHVTKQTNKTKLAGNGMPVADAASWFNPTLLPPTNHKDLILLRT